MPFYNCRERPEEKALLKPLSSPRDVDSGPPILRTTAAMVCRTSATMACLFGFFNELGLECHYCQNQWYCRGSCRFCTFVLAPRSPTYDLLFMLCSRDADTTPGLSENDVTDVEPEGRTEAERKVTFTFMSA